MKTYKFTSDQIVEANNEEEAKEIFADTSFDFASNAEVEQICATYFEPLLEVYGYERCKVDINCKV